MADPGALEEFHLGTRLRLLRQLTLMTGDRQQAEDRLSGAAVVVGPGCRCQRAAFRLVVPFGPRSVRCDRGLAPTQLASTTQATWPATRRPRAPRWNA